MRRIIGPLAIGALLWLVPAPSAQAQIGFAYPGYASYGVSSGYGMPYGYGGYGYGGYGIGATSIYSSGYSSAYVAPGTTYFNSGSYGAYGPIYGAPRLGVPGYNFGSGYGYGYGGAPAVYGYGGAPAVYGYGGLGRYGYTSTGPFMGLPRPFAGLVRVPR